MDWWWHRGHRTHMELTRHMEREHRKHMEMARHMIRRHKTHMELARHMDISRLELTPRSLVPLATLKSKVLPIQLA